MDQPDIDRLHLPIRDAVFAGRAGRDARHLRSGLGDRAGRAAARRCAQRAGRADRRRGVRAGLDVRRTDLDAEPHAPGRGGPALHGPAHRRAVLAHACVAADRTQPSPCRVRLCRRAVGSVPRILGSRAEGLRAVSEDPPAERLLDRCDRQVAPHPEPCAGAGRSVRPLAERVGLRLLLGFPVGRVGSVRPDDLRERCGRAGVRRTERPRLLPARCADRQSDRMAARNACAQGRQTLVPLLLHRLRARAAPRAGAVVGRLPGHVRRRVGRLPRAHVRPPERTRRRAGRRRADSTRRRLSGVGLALRR